MKITIADATGRTIRTIDGDSSAVPMIVITASASRGREKLILPNMTRMSEGRLLAMIASTATA